MRVDLEIDAASNPAIVTLEPRPEAVVAASGSKDAASSGPEPEPEPSADDSVLEHDFDLEYAMAIELD